MLNARLIVTDCAAKICPTSSSDLCWEDVCYYRESAGVKSCNKCNACYRLSGIHALLVFTAHSLSMVLNAFANIKQGAVYFCSE